MLLISKTKTGRRNYRAFCLFLIVTLMYDANDDNDDDDNDGEIPG